MISFKTKMKQKILREKEWQGDIMYSNWQKLTRVKDYSIPSYKGIYFLIEKDEIIYIGSSNNVIQRVRSHRQKKDFSWYWVLECKYISYDRDNKNYEELLKLDHELLKLESYYISIFTPKLNRALPLTIKKFSKGITILQKNGNVKMKGIILNDLIRIDLTTIKYIKKKEVKI